MAMPKLRFKNSKGRDYPKWETNKLANLATFGKGKVLSKADISETGIPMILYGELYTTYGEVVYSVARRTNHDIANLYISDGTEVIIPSSGETPEDISTATYVSFAGVALGGDLIVLKTQGINGAILSYILNHQKKWDIAKMAQGKSVVHISAEGLKKLDICFPSSLEEQEKIAFFLTELDNLISASDEEVKALEDMKKGYMQKIFSQEIRFKADDGSEYPEYKSVLLQEIFIFKYGMYNNNPNNGGKYPIYGANGIIGGFNEYNAENSAVIGHMGAYAGYVLWGNGKHFVTYNGTIAKSKNDNNLSNKYGYYLLVHINLPKICAGTGQPFVSYNDLNNIQITIPCLEEQQKIADFFTALDESIETAKQELEQYRQLKKAMLQQLFV